jgi:hypothetical protein
MKKSTLILTAFILLSACEQEVDNIYYEYQYQEENNMAIDLKNDATLTGRVIIDDPEYPDGKYKDADLDAGVPIKDTGTPIRANELSNIEGFLGALLDLGNLTPSGLADAPNPTVPADRGQYLEALTNWFLDAGLVVGATTPTATTPISYVEPGKIYAVHFPTDATAPLLSYLEQGGLKFQGWVGDSSTVQSAEAEFNIDIADLSVGTNVITYNPSPSLVLTGIKKTALAIISCDLIMREAGVSQTTVSLNPAVVETGTYLEISGAQGFYSPPSLQSFTELKLRIKYDPRFVEQP